MYNNLFTNKSYNTTNLHPLRQLSMHNPNLSSKRKVWKIFKVFVFSAINKLYNIITTLRISKISIVSNVMLLFQKYENWRFICIRGMTYLKSKHYSDSPKHPTHLYKYKHSVMVPILVILDRKPNVKRKKKESFSLIKKN